MSHRRHLPDDPRGNVLNLRFPFDVVDTSSDDGCGVTVDSVPTLPDARALATELTRWEIVQCGSVIERSPR
jgi:hypothetical protein